MIAPTASQDRAATCQGRAIAEGPGLREHRDGKITDRYANRRSWLDLALHSQP
jgi:hypothetical protein